ncbi:hypothetical protein GGS26DRAFT_552282 [Hypomontagnella submonticulosa]|nr:hypothetical protein GGS26DRAFT_552282 [Hypomontagnella submonticulosa]
MPDARLDLGPRVRKDPFEDLPAEIIYDICRHLPSDSISPFIRSSWIVLCIANDRPNFWRHCVRDSMPWFTELEDLISMGALRNESLWKGIFLWAEKRLRVRNNMPMPFAKVTNRRRIWGVCEQLARRYHWVW